MVVQCVIAIGIYILTQYVFVEHELFTIAVTLFAVDGLNAYLYCLMLIFNPLIIFMLLYFMSFFRSIITKDMRLRK